jgi:hypothetical protein
MDAAILKGKQPLSIHVVWMIIIFGILAVYKFIPPTVCVFHELTGYPCLSCGATRAANALFKGDLLGVFYFNPLAVIFGAGLFFFSLFKLLEYIFKFKLILRFNRKTALGARLLLVIIVAANWLFLIVSGR